MSNNGTASGAHVPCIDLLAAIRQELADAIAAAEGQLASERLGGNVVKEHFWLGELAALRRMRVVVEANVSNDVSGRSEADER